MGRSKPKKKRALHKPAAKPAPDAELLRKLGAFIDTGASVTAVESVEAEINASKTLKT